MFEAIREKRATGQPRELVVECWVGELLLRILALGYVLYDEADLPRLPSLVPDWITEGLQPPRWPSMTDPDHLTRHGLSQVGYETGGPEQFILEYVLTRRS